METYKINMKISGAPSVIGGLIKDIEEYGPAGHFAADCKAEIEKSSGAKVQTSIDIRYTDRCITFIMTLTGEGEEFDEYIHKMRNMVLSGDLQRDMSKNGRDRLNVKCTATFERV